jgi:hypothetical protein
MQTLLLAGLADDRLGSLVIEALQSVVYLLPVVTQWTVINDHADVKSEEMWVWYGADGQPVANTPDLLWHRWHVYGLVITLSGRANDHQLFDGFSQQMKKRQVSVTFDAPAKTCHCVRSRRKQSSSSSSPRVLKW